MHPTRLLQVFDIRIEVQAPANGSSPYNNGVPSSDFALYIGGKGGDEQEVTAFYDVEEPAVESYNFTYFEDLFARDNDSATLVNVLARTYRHVNLCVPPFLASSHSAHALELTRCLFGVRAASTRASTSSSSSTTAAARRSRTGPSCPSPSRARPRTSSSSSATAWRRPW